MNPILAGILQGAGLGGQALAQEREKSLDRARQTRRDALLERQVAGQEKSGAVQEELARYKMGEDERTQKREAVSSDLLRDIFRKAQGVAPQPTGVLAPGEDPEGGAFIGATPAVPPMSRRDLLGEILGVPGLSKQKGDLAREGLDPRDKYASSRQGIFNTGTGEVIPGTAEVPRATEGDRRTAEIHSYLQNVRKLAPGTPQYEKEFMDWRNRPLTIFPGGEGYRATDFLGGGPATTPQKDGAPSPTVKVAPNPPAVGTEATANLADFRTLLSQLDRVEALYTKGASQYTGPVQGRLGAARNLTGVGASEEEADYRAELASIQNAIIYLKSGKQINEQEYERLRRELPEASDPEPVFKAKLGRARRLVQTMLSNREAEFQSRGYRGGAPDTTSPPPQPKAPTSQQFNELPDPAQYVGKGIMRNPATGQRVKSDGQRWVPVP